LVGYIAVRSSRQRNLSSSVGSSVVEATVENVDMCPISPSSVR